MNNISFASAYTVSDEELAAANISRSELKAIEDAYQEKEALLRSLGKNFIDEYLYDIEKAGIHSYRYRTKAADHVLEKIVRKRKNTPVSTTQISTNI